jgi:dGTPase
MSHFDKPEWADIHRREEAILASYAIHTRDCRGREYSEEEHAYRGPFQRDRDRVLHSSAFRRLAYKTQVFTGDMGDYHRSRLTHTMEVASVAQTMARVLRLNEDLVQALALLHDVGHPPYGHVGEAVLNECLADDGGFSHNQHALTLACELESRRPEYPGLNLTIDMLEGQRCRIRKYLAGEHLPPLEVQLVDLADSITYNAHDVDDAVKVGLLTLDQVADVPLVARTIESVRQEHPRSEGKMVRKLVVRGLIDVQVTEAIRHNLGVVQEADPRSVADVATLGVRLGDYAEFAREKADLQKFLYENVYKHPELMKIRVRASDQLRRMFHGYLQSPNWLPEKFRERRAEAVGLRRTVGEYLAGMTDRYCMMKCAEHFLGGGGH